MKEPIDHGHQMIVEHKARRQDAIKTIMKSTIIIDDLTELVTKRNMLTITEALGKSLFTRD